MKSLFKYLFLLLFTSTIAQNEQKNDTIGVDIYDALYIVKNNTLFKILEDKTQSYQNFNFGEITSVDIINPLEIVVFYKEFNSAIILDNQLNLKQTIQFTNNILFTSKGITNKIWIYNEDENKLQLYDYKSNTVSISSQVLTDFRPLKMKSSFNNVRLINNKKTLIFDRYLYLQETIIH